MANNPSESVPKPLTCEICFENMVPLRTNIYKDRVKCTKDHFFCQDCIAKYILTKIEAKTAEVRCPGVDCPASLEPVSCRRLIPRKSFINWCDVLADSYIASKGFRRAVCPYEGCSEALIDECKGGGRQECPRCKGVFCFGCGVKWTTDHHKVCSFEEKVFLNTAKHMKWKRCPGCRFFVQRRDGCNRITCRCGVTFCYRCGSQNCHCSSTRCICCLLCLVLLCAVVFFAFIIRYSM